MSLMLIGALLAEMAERRLSSILNSLPSVISLIIHLINTANTRLQLREVF